MKKLKNKKTELFSKRSFEIVVVSILIGILGGILLLLAGASLDKKIIIDFIQLLLIACILGLVVDIRGKLLKK